MTTNADGTFTPDMVATIAPAARSVGDAQDLAITIQGGTPPYRMERGSGRLPRGRRVSQRASAITGTYLMAGQFRYTVRIYDSANQIADVDVIENVGGALSMTVPAGQVMIGTSADVVPVVTGGLAPFKFSLVGGQLPFGRTMSASTGTISGTHNAAAIFVYTIQVEDAAGQRATVDVVQKITPVFAEPIPTPPSGPGAYTPVGPVRSAAFARLKQLALSSAGNNPEVLAESSTGITMTMEAAADAALTQIWTGVTGSNPALSTIARFTGGRYALESNNRIIMPVANAAPANGNLSSLTPATPGYSAWGWDAEIRTTQTKVQARISGNAVRGVRVVVNGRYVSKSVLKNIASSSQNYLTLVFATSEMRSIRFELEGSDQLVHIAVAAGGSILAPVPFAAQGIVLCTGDSYSEGTGATDPGLLAWVRILGRRMGWTDVRQVAVGSTGFLSNNGGARKTIRQQIADWPIVNSDINMSDVMGLLIAGGYNDYAQANVNTLLQAEVLATLQAARAMCPNAFVMVCGSHAGARGPDAQTINVENLIKAAFDQWGDSNSMFLRNSTATPSWTRGTDYVGKANPDGVGNSGVMIQEDGSHPTNLGHNELATRAEDTIRPILLAA